MSQTQHDLPLQEFMPFYPERTAPLHAMLLNCGHQRVDHTVSYNNYGLMRGNNEFVIWQYTLGGRGNLKMGKVNYPVQRGQAMLLFVPEDHVYSLPPDSPEWEFIYISLNGSELVRLAREMRRRSGFLLSHAPDSPTVQFAEHIIAEHIQGNVSTRYQASAMAYEFTMKLLADSGTGATSADDEFLNVIRQYCLKHIDRNLDVDELAKAAGYSRGHFTRKFQELEGMPPHRYVLELKMRLAVRLLQTSSDTVKEIAAACGFEDTSYFCKVFKRFYKSTPAEFRNAT